MLDGSSEPFQSAFLNAINTIEQRDEFDNDYSDRTYFSILITKPPETILVILPPTNQASSPQILGPAVSSCWLFDSHPRPQLGIEGCYAHKFNNRNDLASHLTTLFPFLDLGDDGLVLF